MGALRLEICKRISPFSNFAFLTVSEKARSGDTCGIGPVQVQIRYGTGGGGKTSLCVLKEKKRKEKKDGEKEQVSTFLNRPGLVLGRMTQA